MRVTFDTNVWEHLVRPYEHPNSPEHASLQAVHEAIRSGRISGFMSETFATVEAVKRRARFEYIEARPSPIHVESEAGSDGTIHGQIKIAANPEDHPGLHPKQRSLLAEALALGFKVLPSSRLGTLRPPELQRAEVYIALTEEQNANVWPLVDYINEVTTAIEARGVGMAPLIAIAQRIQRRLGMTDPAWYGGLDQANEAERREIVAAFSEWADGDSIALHVGYGLDVFCTNDRAQTARSSVFAAQDGPLGLRRGWSAGQGPEWSAVPPPTLLAGQQPLALVARQGLEARHSPGTREEREGH
jgi:hypothetical protein